MTFDIGPYRELYPFSSNFLENNGQQYHYLDEGQGETIVMLHGNPTWSFYYRNLVVALRSKYRVIVPDHIGCGLSSKPSDKDYTYDLAHRLSDLETLLEHLGLQDNITIIAHDWGGMIGMSYAVRHAASIKRLVMMNTASFMLPEGKGLPFRLWLLRMIRPFAAVAVRGFNLFAWAATFMATKRGLPESVKKGLTAPYDSWTHRIATLRFVQDIPLTEKDPSYAICKEVEDTQAERLGHLPLMICWGEHDFVFDMDFLAEWERRYPNAEVHRFPKAGHYVLEDEKDAIVPLVQDFLKRHPLV